MRETFYKGAQGNLSLHIAMVSIAALAVDGKVTVSEGLPIGTEVTGVRIINDNLGANTELTVSLDDYSAGSKELATFTTTSAGNDVQYIKPVYIGDEGPSDLVIENSGSAAATGDVTLQLEYRFKGY